MEINERRQGGASISWLEDCDFYTVSYSGAIIKLRI